MATKVGQELVEFSFSQEKTDLGNGVLGYDPKNLDRFTKTVEAYERELKRVFGSLVTTVAQIDQATGQAVRRVYLPKQYEKEALGVRSAVDMQMFGAQGMNSKEAKDLFYQGQQGAHFLETTREIKGAKAQQFAKEAVIDIGGRIIHTPNTANKDMMTTFIPISDAQLGGMSKKDVATFVRDTTPSSNSASRAEQAERTRKEREMQLEQDAKRQQAHLRDLKKQNAQRQRDQEKQQRQAIKEAEQEEKDKIQSRKQTLGRIGKAVTLLGVIADITRRILTSVLNFASDTSKQQTKANTLNMGYQDARNFNYLDKALGLDAGTQLQAQEDLRASFGNTANLDTEKLKWLAMVMGNGVVDEVQSGLGGNNPALLMEKIMDAFFERQQQGVDQYGNQVGQDKARRALVTLLESVSPSIAHTFERMVEEQMNGIHAGDITSFRQLQSFYLPANGGLDSADWSMITLLGKETDELKAKFSNLKDLISGDLTLAFKGVIETLDNLHLGMNEEEAFNANKNDYEQLITWGKEYTAQRASTSARLGEFFSSYGALSGMGIEDIIRYAGYDTAGTEGAERNKIQSARNAVEALFKKPSLYNDLVLYYATGDMLDDIEKEQGKSNPNASPSKYGDAGMSLARRKAEELYLAHLGFLKSNELVFTDALFTRSIEDGAVTFNDVVSDKQDYFTAGANEFFGITKESSRKSDYRKALQDVISKYNKVYRTTYSIDTVLDAVGNNNMSEDARAYWDIVLKNLFTFGTQYSGLSTSTIDTFQGFAKYLPDKHGLTPSEWSVIYNSVGDVTSKRKYKDYTLSSVDITQGSSAGTIDINVNLTDSKGKTTTVKTNVKGTMEGSIKLNEQMEMAMD